MYFFMLIAQHLAKSTADFDSSLSGLNPFSLHVSRYHLLSKSTLITIDFSFCKCHRWFKEVIVESAKLSVSILCYRKVDNMISFFVFGQEAYHVRVLL